VLRLEEASASGPKTNGTWFAINGKPSGSFSFIAVPIKPRHAESVRTQAHSIAMKRMVRQNLCLFVWLTLLLLALTAHIPAQEPVRTAWIVSPAATTTNGSLARARPEVHSVAVSDYQVEVRSAGISLFYFGPLQTPVNPVERLRQLRFLFPLHATPQAGTHTSVRPDVVGVFVNGLPIYNQFEAASYRGQNLWHFDAIANADDGTLVAGGHQRAASQHVLALGLLEKLIADSSGHSPLIGFAFDGYPIYGPWGFATAGGGVRRMRSGYRLRQIKRRTQWPDGTALTPNQCGPEVSEEFPLGTFAEDYEYVAGAGDLDQFNGRFAKTPEYPAGTYAYFLSTDEAGRLAYPYLLAREYYGKLSADELRAAVQEDGESFAPTPGNEITPALRAGQPKLLLRTDATTISAGTPTRLSFQVRTPQGAPIRFLEYVHERPLHLLVVSEDLAEFAHIHPALVAGDRYEVTHTFAHGGRYRLYADFTPPGFAGRVETFEITVAGKPRPAAALVADAVLEKIVGSIRVALSAAQLIRAGEDLELAFALRDATTGERVTNLAPYLGAWAHCVIIDQKQQSFLHAHPLETNETRLDSNPFHVHGAEARPLGPPPAQIRLAVNFPQPGLYKLWAQFQRDEQVITVPFTVEVAAAPPLAAKRPVTIPADAIQITVGDAGYTPARIEVRKGQTVKLAFIRLNTSSCGGTVVFPSLKLKQKLPVGETVVIEITPTETGELSFTCGLGMYRGALIVN
jgi:plastocyanin